MSRRCMPIIFLNMAGEMTYILEQRLRVNANKNVDAEKCDKVLHDIIVTMLSRRLLEELFKPQDAHSRKALRMFFDRLAHSSIMRLNESSMEKLFDLMTMAIKWQVICVRAADQLLAITLNHLNGVKKVLPDNKEVENAVQNAYEMVMEVYGHLAHWEWAVLRQGVLNFFEEVHIKVSVLLRDGKQLDTGRFVLDHTELHPKAEIPGCVKYYDHNGALDRTAHFVSPMDAKRQYHEGSTDSTELTSTGRTKFGTNIFKTSSDALQVRGRTALSGYSDEKEHSDELKLLAEIVGRKPAASQSDGFALSLFDTNAEEKSFVGETLPSQHRNQHPQSDVKRIDGAKTRNVTKTLAELKVSKPGSAAGNGKSKDAGADMLALLDEAAARPSTAQQKGQQPPLPPPQPLHPKRPASAKRATRTAATSGSTGNGTRSQSAGRK